MIGKSFFLSCLFFLFLCLSFQSKNDERDIVISIKPVFRKDILKLDTTQYITDLNDTVSFTALKFYISKIELEYENGSKFKESKSYHLIDLDKPTSLQFTLKKVTDSKIKKINFDIGIDSLTNVSNDFEGDLDPSLGMYWAWNSGYINMKLEGKSNSCTSAKKDFHFHIGGYLPNQNALQQISLPIVKKSNQLELNVDVSKWLNKTSLKETHSIMIPGKKAISMAQLYKNIFFIDEEK